MKWRKGDNKFVYAFSLNDSHALYISPFAPLFSLQFFSHDNCRRLQHLYSGEREKGMAKPKQFEGDLEVFRVEPRMSSKGNRLMVTLQTTYNMREHINLIKLLQKKVRVQMIEMQEQPELDGVEAEEFEEEEEEDDKS